MQENENDVLLKQNMFEYIMRKFGPEDVIKANLFNFGAKMTAVENYAYKLVESIEKLLLFHEPQLGRERAAQWRAKQVTHERNIKDYRRCMEKRASDLRKDLNPTQNQNVPNFQVDPNTFQAEQLRIKIQGNKFF